MNPETTSTSTAVDAGAVISNLGVLRVEQVDPYRVGILERWLVFVAISDVNAPVAMTDVPEEFTSHVVVVIPGALRVPTTNGRSFEFDVGGELTGGELTGIVATAEATGVEAEVVPALSLPMK